MHQGIGNGLPLAAVVTTPEIASVMAQKLQFNTFGGNPVCSAGGLAVLRVLDKEKRQSHCADVGSHLIQRLRSLMQIHDSTVILNLIYQKDSCFCVVIYFYFLIHLPFLMYLYEASLHRTYICHNFVDYFDNFYICPVIGDVRGRGLMVGIEFVTDRK